jgi:hypothetical protein
MLIFWDVDICPMSCATRWAIGAVEVTHGHELGGAARSAPALVCADAAGTPINPARLTAATAVTTRRFR